MDIYGTYHLNLCPPYYRCGDNSHYMQWTSENMLWIILYTKICFTSCFILIWSFSHYAIELKLWDLVTKSYCKNGIYFSLAYNMQAQGVHFALLEGMVHISISNTFFKLAFYTSNGGLGATKTLRWQEVSGCFGNSLKHLKLQLIS